jgi:hypothetical protein
MNGPSAEHGQQGFGSPKPPWMWLMRKQISKCAGQGCEGPLSYREISMIAAFIVEQYNWSDNFSNNYSPDTDIEKLSTGKLMSSEEILGARGSGYCFERVIYSVYPYCL